MANTQTMRAAVTTIWRNTVRSGPSKGRPYWKLVLDDGSSLLCYDSGVAKAVVPDPEEQMTKFNPAKPFDFLVELRGDRSVIAGLANGDGTTTAATDGAPMGGRPIPKPSLSPAAPARNGGNGMSKEDWAEKDNKIARMSVLKTAVEYIAAGGGKPADLRKITQEFEEYVTTGAFPEAEKKTSKKSK